MGVVKIIRKSQADNDYLKNCLEYVTRGHSIYSFGVNINPSKAYKQMMKVKEYYGKTSGNQLIHFIVCFDKNVCHMDTAKKICLKIANYYKDQYQIVCGIHRTPRFTKNGFEKSSIHAHFIINSVSFINGKMYAENKKEQNEFIKYVNEVICS